MTKKVLVRLIAVVLAVAMPLVTGIVAFAGDGEGASGATKETKYESPDINVLTGHGEEPEELSVTSGATYLEKAWYEYVTYSEKPVASYKLDDNSRLVFYDPYTYTNSLIMETEMDANTTEFDTMSSYTVSYMNSKTIEACVSSTSTKNTAVETAERDETYSFVQNGGTTETAYNHSISSVQREDIFAFDQYAYREVYSESKSESVVGIASLEGFGKIETETDINPVAPLTKVKVHAGMNYTTGTEIGKVTNYNVDWVTDKSIHNEYKNNTTNTLEIGNDTITHAETAETTGWTQLGARITSATGSARSMSNTISESESITITKNYAATHFAADGVTPLPWALVHYRVLMPMKCVLEVKHSGEWIELSTIYTLMTTIQGTCRTWIENGQAYYEDWGSGEPVIGVDFWGNFTTRENLMNAYKNKLYPVGGAG
ncbi:MAG TPA: hypothetical protein GXZ23_03625 [Clostridiales bacterium]|nr:hypothetical protein [Clostridiales bacterium]